MCAAKAPGGDRETGLAQLSAKRPRPAARPRRRGAAPSKDGRRPRETSAEQGELRDHQEAAADLGKVEVHLAGRVLEQPQPGELAAPPAAATAASSPRATQTSTSKPRADRSTTSRPPTSTAAAADALQDQAHAIHVLDLRRKESPVGGPRCVCTPSRPRREGGQQSW